ncbi:MAG: ankyrin repeat domain-containing protein [Sedimentisphaerales bacterium]|nr:ankyrin repeat domain-containing protein [Sedimentisphaerales bacterium]
MKVILSSIICLFLIILSPCSAQTNMATLELFQACQAKDIDKVHKSIEEGAEIDARDNLGLTPLFYALSGGSREVMDLLISKGADINQSIGSQPGFDTDDSLQPLIMWAVDSENQDMVEYLLAQGATTDCVDSQGVLLIGRAASCNNFEIFKLIADREGNMDKYFRLDIDYIGTLLHAAVGAENIKTVNYLLDHKVNIDARDSHEYSPLFIAAMAGNLEITKLLVEHSADIYTGTSWGRSLQDNAQHFGSNKAIDYLQKIFKEKHTNEPPPSWMRFIKTDTPWNDIDMKGLENYIQEGQAFWGTDSMGNTLLHYVAGKDSGNGDLLMILIDWGLDVNARNAYKETPLHKAVRWDEVKNVEILLSRGADVHARDKDGNTPLNIMANNYANGVTGEEDERAITEMLLEKGADADPVNIFGITPLFKLAEDKMDHHLGLAGLLIAHGADVNHQTISQDTPLHEAADIGTVKMMELLLEAGARLDTRNISGNTPIHTIGYDSQEKYDLVFKYKKDISVIEAVYYAQYDILEDLIRNGGDVEQQSANHNATGLIVAARQNNARMITKLLELHADINARDDLGNTGLHYAAERGNDDAVWALLKSGADIHIRNNDGLTAMDLAAAQDKFRTLQLFKDAYPDLETSPPAIEEGEPDTEITEDDRGATPGETISEEELKEHIKKQLAEQINNPFHKAVALGDIDAIKKMLDNNGIDVNETDNLDSVPLMYASYMGYQDIVKLLLDHGGDIDFQNDKGMTCLFLAIISGNQEMVRLLLELGADPALQNGEGMNALQLAKLTQQENIALIIQEADPDLGADIEEWVKAADDEFEKMEEELKKHEQDWMVDQLCSQTRNPFHLAIIKGDMEQVKAMIAGGNIDVNGLDKAGKLPLIYAAVMEHRDMVTLLLEHGAEINGYDTNPGFYPSPTRYDDREEGWGVLHYLAESGNIGMLEFMTEKGADVNLPEKGEGQSPFFIAIKNYKFDFAGALIKAGADIHFQNKRGNTILHEAACDDEIEKIKKLIELGADIEVKNKNGVTPLMAAARCGEDDTMIYLLQQGADPGAVDNDGNNALHDTVSKEYTSETIRILIEYGIDINQRNNQGETPLFRVFDSGFYEDCRKNAQILLREGADMTIPNDDGDTILHLAVRERSPEIARLAIEYGVEVNTKNKQGNTPLQELVDPFLGKIKSMEIIILLVENGANPNDQTHWGWTTLQSAVKRGWPDVVSYFIENGADVNVCSTDNRERNTPLHVAVNEGFADIVKILIDHGADIDAINTNNQTPLHIAVRMEEIPIVRLLLEAGARSDIPDNRDRTALDWARNVGNEEILSLFE